MQLQRIVVSVYAEVDVQMRRVSTESFGMDRFREVCEYLQNDLDDSVELEDE